MEYETNDEIMEKTEDIEQDTQGFDDRYKAIVQYSVISKDK